MALLRALMLKEYWGRLEHWRRELDRAAIISDTEAVAEAHVHIADYERIIRELTREES
jgi:hypothetical protein